MFNNFRGLLYFKCVGEAPEILINLMKNANIVWFDVKRQKDTVSGIIYKRDYSALKNFSEKAKMELSIERKKGFIFKALRYKKRYGILAGFLLACFFIFFMSNTVLTIEIEGNNLVSRDKILSVLKNNGITEGKFIPNINFRNVERNVTTSFKNIAFAAVRSKGGRVIVEVDEVEEPPYIIPRNIPCNIVADRDAQLVNASVLDGKLIPKIGEAVKKGDLLVSGTYIDKHNKVTVLHSQAQITGRYNESISFVQPLLEEENKPTGEVINGKDLSFFGIRIPISFNKKIISEYEYEENIQNLSFFSIKLPLSIVHKTYKLIDKQEISYTKETAEIKINEQIENFEKTFYKDKTIVSKEIVKGETENSISFKINYVIEGEIGTKKLFIAK